METGVQQGKQMRAVFAVQFSLLLVSIEVTTSFADDDKLKDLMTVRSLSLFSR
jgi:hypothetical protein